MILSVRLKYFALKLNLIGFIHHLACAGTSVDLYGTTDIRRHRGTPDPTCECFIDGVSIGAVDPFGFAENNWRLCGAPNLTDGAHTLTVNVRSRGQTFWVDYIAFTASSIVSTSNEVYQMQNINPGIQYDPSWQPFASGMTDLTSRKGATVSLTFLGRSFHSDLLILYLTIL